MVTNRCTYIRTRMYDLCARPSVGPSFNRPRLPRGALWPAAPRRHRILAWEEVAFGHFLSLPRAAGQGVRSQTADQIGHRAAETCRAHAHAADIAAIRNEAADELEQVQTQAYEHKRTSTISEPRTADTDHGQSPRGCGLSEHEVVRLAVTHSLPCRRLYKHYQAQLAVLCSGHSGVGGSSPRCNGSLQCRQGHRSRGVSRSGHLQHADTWRQSHP